MVRTSRNQDGYSVKRSRTMEYWQDGEWLVGKVKELPGVFSQGRTIEELTENIQDACVMMATPKTEDRRPRTDA